MSKPLDQSHWNMKTKAVTLYFSKSRLHSLTLQKQPRIDSITYLNFFNFLYLFFK